MVLFQAKKKAITETQIMTTYIILRKVLFTQFTYRANITITRNLFHEHPNFFSDIIPHSNCPSYSLPAADKQNGV